MAVPVQFNGLSMPVFTAFGWAGEEQAIKFALSQLEEFVSRLHANLSQEMRSIFPYHGLDRAAEAAYLSANEEVEQGAHIIFRAKPLTLTMVLALSDKRKLARVFRRADKEPDEFYKLIKYLGEGWEMHIQQMEILDEETEEAAHYKDIFKDSTSELTPETVAELSNRTSYLNSEVNWVAPIYFSNRMPAEQISTMGATVIKHMNEVMVRVLPMARFLSNTSSRLAPKTKEREVSLEEADETTTAKALRKAGKLEEFVFVSKVKTLHIRKGFINLTPEHWPFFAEGARSTTRDIIVNFGEDKNEEATVWRLVSSDQARIVLETEAQNWLADAISPDERVQISALKDENEDIAVTLKPVA